MNFFQKQKERLKWALTSRRKKEKEMYEIETVVNILPETRSLLIHAKKNNVKIKFSASLIGKNFGAYYNAAENAIVLSPMKGASSGALALVHELRHYWQSLVLQTDHTHAQDDRLSKINADLKTYLIFTRIIEADAYAFGSLMAHKMTEAIKYINNIGLLIKEKIDQGMSPEEAQKAIVDQENNKSPQIFSPLDEKEFLKKSFFENLKLLDNYDRNKLRSYYACYISDTFESTTRRDPAKKLTINKMRQILRAGLSMDNESYMTDITDARFGATILDSTNKDLRKTMRLIEKFEKAAAKGQLNDDKKAVLRKDIQTRVWAIK